MMSEDTEYDVELCDIVSEKTNKGDRCDDKLLDGLKILGSENCKESLRSLKKFLHKNYSISFCDQKLGGEIFEAPLLFHHLSCHHIDLRRNLILT